LKMEFHMVKGQWISKMDLNTLVNLRKERWPAKELSHLNWAKGSLKESYMMGNLKDKELIGSLMVAITRANGEMDSNMVEEKYIGLTKNFS